MKTAIVLSVVMILLLAGSASVPSSAEDTTKNDTPTFYRLVPGTYVNGYPRFTIHYPKEWIEKSRMLLEVFHAEPPPSAPRSALSVNVFSNPNPVDKLAEVVILPFFKLYAQDVTIVSDKPTRLKDGTSAWEVETKMVMNGEPITVLNVATKQGDVWVNTGTRSYTGKIERYQRDMLYSLEYESGKNAPVAVPPDVKTFLDQYVKANVSHDIARVMALVSDRYVYSGTRKAEVERDLKPLIDRTASFEIVITEFIPAGDTAYLTGFTLGWFGKGQLLNTSIIKENGEWKWYGNQRDVAP